VLAKSSVFFGSQYLKKYQEESTKVSIVSTSGVQPFPNIFSVLSKSSLEFFNGASPVGIKSTSVGKIQGKFSSPTNFASPVGE
jgi:hypothetical protein